MIVKKYTAPTEKEAALKAKEELGWVATKTLNDMCKDSWNYIVKKDKI